MSQSTSVGNLTAVTLADVYFLPSYIRTYIYNQYSRCSSNEILIQIVELKSQLASIGFKYEHDFYEDQIMLLAEHTWIVMCKFGMVHQVNNYHSM